MSIQAGSEKAQREDDVRRVVSAASAQLAERQRAELHRLATILANTRPDDGGTEGEWAVRLYEAGVRPPRPRPKPFHP